MNNSQSIRHLKRPPSPDDIEFINILSKIREQHIQGTDHLATIKIPWRRKFALELLNARNDNEEDFWKVYNAQAAIDHKELNDWRALVLMPAPPDDKPKERTYQLHPLSYFKNLPPKEWGVKDIMRVRGTAVVCGDGGSGKSTMVLDMGLSRVCNVPFIGRAVKPAFLIWVAAESSDEFYPRVAAWLACHNISEDEPLNMLALDGRVPFNNTAEVEIFIEEVQEQITELHLPEDLPLEFVFDTYDKCTPGADENSTQETKVSMQAVDLIHRTFDAHVIIIHHTNAQGRIRGNTALRDHVDTVWLVSKEQDTIKLECNKMRGAREPENFYVEMRSIVLDENNPDETAPVVFSTEVKTEVPLTPKVQQQMLELLNNHGQLTCNQWAQHCEKTYGIASRTFYSHKKQLLINELIIDDKDQGKGKGTRVYCRLSEKGLN